MPDKLISTIIYELSRYIQSEFGLYVNMIFIILLHNEMSVALNFCSIVCDPEPFIQLLYFMRRTRQYP